MWLSIVLVCSSPFADTCNIMMDVEKIIRLVKKNPDNFKLMPGSKLFFKNSNVKDFDKIKDLKNLLHIISRK